jgi:hypothetical protein
LVLSLIYCIVLSIRYFSNYREWRWCFSFKNLHTMGYQVPPSVETGCLPCPLIKSDMNLSATSMFLSLEIDNARISLLFATIATHHNHMYSEPTLSIVSSTMNSENLILLVDIFLGWYFWIQLQMVTWFLLMKQNSLCNILLKYKPEKHKYRPPRRCILKAFYFYNACMERRLQAIDLSLNEHSPLNTSIFCNFIYWYLSTYRQLIIIFNYKNWNKRFCYIVSGVILLSG